MARAKKLNGWQIRHANLYIEDLPPAGESRWEKLLVQLGVEEDKVLTVLHQRDDRTMVLRLWIRQNARYAFIPEPVLKFVGIHPMDLI